MPPRRRKRIDPAAFRLPVDEIKSGIYTDAYFTRAREVLRQEKRVPTVVMQFTGKNEGWVSGVDEAIAMLKLCADDWTALTVQALYEGDSYESWDTVLTIEGPYDNFGFLETLCLGVLGRRTRICTNAKMLCEAAQSKPVMFFGARDDIYATQPGDGYAAMVGGVKLVSTPAQASLFGGNAVGTIPHALIAAFGGDTVKATKRFAEAIQGVDVIALVDYDNDCVKASLDVARAFDGQLWGVRLDTAENLVDKSIIPQMGTFDPTGVNANLVWNVRNALDAEGFGDVKIVVSGGFNEERIRAFEEEGVPVDAYGVGAAIYDGRFDFTADVVQVNGKSEAKAGRRLRENPRLERVK
ncbi:MAG TPA: nicotinate phosphoribosyltransferase [Gemmatimonadaceae bacterium]|jgi:nicotinate phosphoribosyltransferase|nr:nicotinate phosphoribosyltransferase [Gemmatimonadaceae bacterium]